MNRFLASSCLAVLAVGSTAAAAQDADIPREVVDAFINGGAIVSSGEVSEGGCEATSDEEYMRTGVETICGERNTIVFLGGNEARPTPAPAPRRTNPTPTSRPAVAPAPTPRPQPRPVVIPERCAPSEREALNMCLTFGLGSSELTDRAKSQISVFAQSMLDNQSTERFVIAGHTDTSGTETRNCELSHQRAQSVVSFMVGMGVSADQLQPVGYGQTHLQNGVPATDPRNRRVEIVRGAGEAPSGQSCKS